MAYRPFGAGLYIGGGFCLIDDVPGRLFALS